MRHIFPFLSLGSFRSSLHSQQRSQWAVWYFFCSSLHWFYLIVGDFFLFIAHSIFKSIYLSEWLLFCFDAKPKVSWESECERIERKKSKKNRDVFWICSIHTRASLASQITVAHNSLLNREKLFPKPFFLYSEKWSFLLCQFNVKMLPIELFASIAMYQCACRLQILQFVAQDTETPFIYGATVLL